MSPSHSSVIRLSSALLAASFLIQGGCDSKSSEPAPAPLPTPTPPAPAAKPPQATQPVASPSQGQQAVMSIQWQAPQDWKEMPKRPMRQATYQIGEGETAAEVAVFYFGPGQGGTVEANLARWAGQFQNVPEGGEKRSEREVNGMKHFSVSVNRGTFASGMPMGRQTPKENWGLRATIVQAKGGQYFFKLTGPSETVAENEAAFTKMLDGILEK